MNERLTVTALHRDECLNKYIEYRDKNGATRTGKVVKISGNTMTVKNAVGVKERVTPDKIHGVYYRKNLINIVFSWKTKK